MGSGNQPNPIKEFQTKRNGTKTEEQKQILDHLKNQKAINFLTSKNLVYAQKNNF